jgi:hypothetical protein
MVDGHPACDLCVDELERKKPRTWAFFAAFAGITTVFAVTSVRVMPGDVAAGVVVSCLILVAVGLALTVRSVRRGPTESITRRDSAEPALGDTLSAGPHPFRGRFARVAQRALPPISARWTTAILCVAFAVAAIAVPVSLRLPRWIETEIVVGVVWALFFGVLSALLYRGAKVKDHHALRMRWELPSLPSFDNSEGKGSGSTSRRRSSWLDADPGCADAEGCVGLLIGLALAAVAVAAAWLLVELIFPLVFFVLYWLVLKAVARVANDAHGCEGSLGRSLGWGAIWATVYSAPFALIVYVVHRILAARS